MDEGDVLDYFDANSSQYSHSRDVATIEDVPEMYATLCSLVDESSRVLDIGCGEGETVEYAEYATQRGNYVGVDISRKMLPSSSTGAVDYLQASATDLPFSPESFDIVVLSDILHHLVGSTRRESKQKAKDTLAECKELVDEGGKIVLKEQYHEGPIRATATASVIIFHGLKRGNSVLKWVTEQVEGGLLTSFYTRSEILEMVNDIGDVVDQSEESRKPNSVFHKLLLRNSGRIRLVIEM